MAGLKMEGIHVLPNSVSNHNSAVSSKLLSYSLAPSGERYDHVSQCES